MRTKKRYVIFLLAAVVILALPSLWTAIAGGSSWDAETSDLADPPSLYREDGSVNTALLSDAGAYFEDHFALRPALISTNSAVLASLFETSVVSEVTAGKDGWLYYSGDLPDLQKTNRLTDREIWNIAHNLSLVKEYYDLLGIRFVVTIAPNKSTLYPEQLPAYVVPVEGESNADRVAAALTGAGIPYADLFAAFEAEEDCLYLKEDSHWNNLGAALAEKTITEVAERTDAIDFTEAAYTWEAVHSGDLAELVYPNAVTPEEDAVFDTEQHWQYTSDTQDNMDSYITTENPERTGSLYLFRDSFGASLVPLCAEEYGSCVFSRYTPYKISDPVVAGVDTVVLEKVERKLSELCTEAPLMQNPVRSVTVTGETDSESACNLTENGGFLVLYGAVDEALFDDTSEIYLEVTDPASKETAVYEAFYLMGQDKEGNTYDSTYQVNLLKPEGGSGRLDIRLLTGHSGEVTAVGSYSLEYE